MDPEYDLYHNFLPPNVSGMQARKVERTQSKARTELNSGLPGNFSKKSGFQFQGLRIKYKF